MPKRMNTVRNTGDSIHGGRIPNRVNFLAVDATSRNLSLHIRYGKTGEVSINRKIDFGASRLVSYIDKSLKKVKIRLSDIDAFVIGSGPGSFTGLRISFSLVKAFIMAEQKPAIAIPSFYSCAYRLSNKAESLAVVSDARRNLIYLSRFKVKNKKLTPVGKEMLVALEELIKIGKGHLFTTYDSHLRDKILSLYPKINFYPKDIFPEAKYLMPLAELYYNKGKFTNLERLEPLYLHPKTCQVRKCNG